MNPTRVAIRKCANWLRFCRSIGWRDDAINGLFDLWWKYHDDNGELYPPGQTRP